MYVKFAIVWSFSKIHCHPRNVKLTPVYSYSPSKSVFISEMKYTASQFTSIHCLEPVSMHQSITTPLSPRAPLSLMEFNNKTTATGTNTSLRKCIRAASNFIALIPSRLIRQMLAISFLELNSRGLYQTSENDYCLVFTSSTKREISRTTRARKYTKKAWFEFANEFPIPNLPFHFNIYKTLVGRLLFQNSSIK